MKGNGLVTVLKRGDEDLKSLALKAEAGQGHLPDPRPGIYQKTQHLNESWQTALKIQKNHFQFIFISHLPLTEPPSRRFTAKAQAHRGAKKFLAVTILGFECASDV